MAAEPAKEQDEKLIRALGVPDAHRQHRQRDGRRRDFRAARRRRRRFGRRRSDRVCDLRRGHGAGRHFIRHRWQPRVVDGRPLCLRGSGVRFLRRFSRRRLAVVDERPRRRRRGERHRRFGCGNFSVGAGRARPGPASRADFLRPGLHQHSRRARWCRHRRRANHRETVTVASLHCRGGFLHPTGRAGMARSGRAAMRLARPPWCSSSPSWESNWPWCQAAK